MCTSIALKTDDFYFGRNMDLEYEFGERVVIVPRNYPFFFRKAGCIKNHYAIIGMASVMDGYPLFAEASNEKGLCIAGLNFPENAYYPPEVVVGKNNISPFELIPWLLCKCTTVGEVKKVLKSTHIVSIPFNSQTPLSPLHWHIADKNGSIVLECTKEGVFVYDNPVGVMTNNPPFPFQTSNLCQYMNLSTQPTENCFNTIAGLQPFGCGLGSFGLPGDFSPASRFVKMSYLLLNSVCEGDENSSVSQLFHLLSSVSMVRGCVILPSGKHDITTYTCCINADKGIYYYNTYANCQITAVHMNHENLNTCQLIEFPLQKTPQFSLAN